eukprot:tig00000147_g9485.t1
MGPKKGNQPAKRSKPANEEESSGSGSQLAAAVGASQLELLPDNVIQRILTFVGLHDSWKCARGISKRIRAMLIANEWERLTFPGGSLRAQTGEDVVRDIAGWTKRARRGHVRVQSLFVQAAALCPKRDLVPALVAALPGLKHVAIRHGDVSAGGYTDGFPPRPTERALRGRHQYAAALLRAAAASSGATLATFEFMLDVDALNAHDAVAQTPPPTGRLEREFLAELRKLPALRRLNLAHYCSMEPEFVRGIARAAPNLTSLKFASAGDFREAFDDADGEEEEAEGPALESIAEALAEGFPHLELPLSSPHLAPPRHAPSHPHPPPHPYPSISFDSPVAPLSFSSLAPPELDVEWGGNSVEADPLETVGGIRTLRVLALRCRELAEGALAGLVRGLRPDSALSHLEIREAEGSIDFEGQFEPLRAMASLRRLEVEVDSGEPATWAALGSLSQLEHLSLRLRVAGCSASWAYPAAFPRLQTLFLTVDGCAGREQAGFFGRLADQLAAPWGLRELSLVVVPTSCICETCSDGTGPAALAAALARFLALDAVRRALVHYDRCDLQPRQSAAEVAALAGCSRLAFVRLTTGGRTCGPLKPEDAEAFAPLGRLAAKGRKFCVTAAAGAASAAAAERLYALLPGWLVQIPERRRAFPPGAMPVPPALLAMLSGMRPPG